ncbi:MAG: hypothetical protein U0527_09785 [Candidatus Eisenbacteria bacterium]
MSPALAGVNAGGVILLSTEEALTYQPDGVDCGELQLRSCVEADTRVDGTEITVVSVLAEWKDSAAPRLSGVSFGISYDENSIQVVDWGRCSDFALPDGAWPGSGSGIGLSWNQPVTATRARVMWFALQHLDATPVTFAVVAHPVQGARFADDSVPAKLDTVVGLGTLGFDTNGTAPCPLDDINCCLPDGSCHQLNRMLCSAASGIDAGVACDDGVGNVISPKRLAVVAAPTGYSWSRPLGGAWSIGCPPDVFGLSESTRLALRAEGGPVATEREARSTLFGEYFRTGVACRLLPGSLAQVGESDIWIRRGSLLGSVRDTHAGFAYDTIRMAHPSGTPRVWTTFGAFGGTDSVGVLCTVDSVAAEIRFELVGAVGQPWAETVSTIDSDRVLSAVGQYAVYDFDGHLIDSNATQAPTQVPNVSKPLCSEIRVQPNPAREFLGYELTLGGPAAVRVELLDVSGRVRSQIFDGTLGAGPNALRWTPPAGLRPSAGLYYLRAITSAGTRSTRLLWLH